MDSNQDLLNNSFRLSPDDTNNCTCNSSYCANDGKDTSLKEITITAKLQYVGSILAEKAASYTSKLIGKVSTTLVTPEADKPKFNYDDFYEERNNDHGATDIETVSQYDCECLDEVEKRIAEIESIFASINADLYPSECQCTGTQTHTCCDEDDINCKEENCRHKMVVDEFSTTFQNINKLGLGCKPAVPTLPIFENMLNSMVPKNKSPQTKDAVGKDSNVRSMILKWD